MPDTLSRMYRTVNPSGNRWGAYEHERLLKALREAEKRPDDATMAASVKAATTAIATQLQTGGGGVDMKKMKKKVSFNDSISPAASLQLSALLNDDEGSDSAYDTDDEAECDVARHAAPLTVSTLCMATREQQEILRAYKSRKSRRRQPASAIATTTTTASTAIDDDADSRVATQQTNVQHQTASRSAGKDELKGAITTTTTTPIATTTTTATTSNTPTDDMAVESDSARTSVAAAPSPAAVVVETVNRARQAMPASTSMHTLPPVSVLPALPHHNIVPYVAPPRSRKKGEVRVLTPDEQFLIAMEKRGCTAPATQLEKDKLITTIHQQGHYGEKHIYHTLLNQQVWWPGIRADIRNIMQDCLSAR